MSVIWSGVTEEGAVVPVQVTAEGKVVAVGDGPQGDYLPTSGGNLTGDLTLGTDKITLSATDGSAQFAGEVRVGNSKVKLQNNSDRLDILAQSATGSAELGATLTVSQNVVVIGSSTSTGIGEVKSTGSSVIYCNEQDGNLELGVRKSGTRIGHMASVRGDGVFIGNLPTNPNISLNADGSAAFAGDIQAGGNPTDAAGANAGLSVRNNGQIIACGAPSLPIWSGKKEGVNGSTSLILANGSAEFSGDVVIGSRGEKWLIRESNGVAMLVQQSREAAPMDSPMSGVSPVIPEQVRDIPSELDLIEMALNEVMEKLRMTPPAGWPVWDGSDNP